MGARAALDWPRVGIYPARSLSRFRLKASPRVRGAHGAGARRVSGATGARNAARRRRPMLATAQPESSNEVSAGGGGGGGAEAAAAAEAQAPG